MANEIKTEHGQEKGSIPDEEHDPPSTDNSSLRSQKPWAFYLSFVSLVLMVLIVSLDATILPVALPILTRQLSGTTIESFWANLAFILPVAVTQPLYTTFSNSIGRKIPLYIAFVFFAAGSIAFAVGNSMSIVILGRTLQGFGGGGLDVLNEIILADITTLQERPFYVGLMAIPIATGSIAGPIIGAAFAQDVSWRWIGWINLPIVGASAALAILFLPSQLKESSYRSNLRRMDFIGMIMFTIGATAFAIPLSLGDSLAPWSSAEILVPFVIGLVLLLIFAVYEKRPTNAVFPYRIFNTRTSAVTIFTSFFHGLITYPLLFWMPLFFQAIKSASSLRSAVLILPFCCGLIAFSLLSGIVVGVTGRPREVFWFAWTITSVGVGLFALWDSQTTIAETAGLQIMAGAGVGMLFTVSPIIVQAAVKDPKDQGLAVGILVCFRLFGGLVGLAIGSTVFNSIFKSSIANIGSLPQSIQELTTDPQFAVSFIPQLRNSTLGSQTRVDLQDAYLDAIRDIWYVLAACSSLAAIASFFVKLSSLKGDKNRS